MYIYKDTAGSFGCTSDIRQAFNFQTVANAQDFLQVRMKTVRARLNRLLTAFRIVEIYITIVLVIPEAEG